MLDSISLSHTEASNPTMLQLFIIYILPILISAFFLIKWNLTTSNTHKNPPPSPRKLPLIGNIHQIGRNNHRSFHSLSKRYGPVMLLHLGKVPAVVVSSSDAAREVRKTHDLNFLNTPKSTIAERLLYNCHGLSASPYGEYWRQLRSIAVVHLLSNRKVRSFGKVRDEEVALCLQKIEDISLKSLPVNLSDVLISYTNDVICRAALGRKYGVDESMGIKFQRLLRDLDRLLVTVNIGEFIPWLRWINVVNGLDAEIESVAKEFDEFLDGVVEDHLNKEKLRDSEEGSDESEERRDFIDVMLQLQKENPVGSTFGRISIKAVTLDAFVGGTHTTSTFLEWTMSELLRHPRVLKQLQDEIKQTANGKAFVSEEDIEKMPFFKAVLKEVLRLHPPVPLLVPRVSSEDIKIQGYDISAGTMVIINSWSIGRDPLIWKEPDEFKPERFLNSSIDFKGHDFELIPFGAGRRGCPGTAFAIAAAEIVLANLVQKFDWSLPEGMTVEDIDMTESASPNIRRKFPLLAVATPAFS